jgi:hypothetical protein
VQVPAVQAAPAGQTRPQAPQLAVSVWAATQRTAPGIPQAIWAVGHTHIRDWQD